MGDIRPIVLEARRELLSIATDLVLGQYKSCLEAMGTEIDHEQASPSFPVLIYHRVCIRLDIAVGMRWLWDQSLLGRKSGSEWSDI